MGKTCFDCARPMFRLCLTYVSTVLDLCVDCIVHMFYLCSAFVSTVLELCFECARPIFRLCSTFVSTFLTEIVYVSTYVLSVLDLFSSVLDPDCAHEPESAEHMIVRCQKWNEKRQETFEDNPSVSALQDILDRIIHFLRRIGRL